MQCDIGMTTFAKCVLILADMFIVKDGGLVGPVDWLNGSQSGRVTSYKRWRIG